MIDAFLTAMLTKSRGGMEKAAQHLQEAVILAEDLDLPGERWSVQVALGELSLIRDEQEQTQRAFKRAATIVGKLAENLRENGMKANFLASPPVQRVLEQSSIRL